jgi:hypothetical protein
MKKGLMILVLLAGVGFGGYALAHYWGPGFGGWGHMMGPGHGWSCWEYGYGPPAPGQTQSLTQEDAKGIVKNYYIGPNPNLKVGTIQDKGTYFEVEIQTKDGSLVTRLGIDKQTGWIRPIY